MLKVSVAKEHKATQSCFPVLGPIIDQATSLFFLSFFRKLKLKENVQTAKCTAEGGLGQDYTLQTVVYPRNQNIEAWMM